MAKHGRSVSKSTCVSLCSLLDSTVCKHHGSPGIANKLMTGQAIYMLLMIHGGETF